MPHMEPITVGIIYRPPNQCKFLDIFEGDLPIFEEIYLNSTQAIVKFTSWVISTLIFLKTENMFSRNPSNNKNLDSFTKKYHGCCTLFCLKQLIKYPTRVTCNSSSILDHVLASFLNSISQSGVIDIDISDHQLIYCTRKTARIKATAINKLLFILLKIIHLRFMKRL